MSGLWAHRLQKGGAGGRGRAGTNVDVARGPVASQSLLCLVACDGPCSL